MSEHDPNAPEPERRRFAYGARKPGWIEKRDEAQKELESKADLLAALLPVALAAVDLAPHIKTLSPRMDGNHVCVTSTSASPTLLEVREAVRALSPATRATLARLAKEKEKSGEEKNDVRA